MSKRLSINTATLEEIITLRNIGQKKAERIIQFREKNGYFQNPDDLTKIEGISLELAQELASEIDFQIPTFREKISRSFKIGGVITAITILAGFCTIVYNGTEITKPIIAFLLPTATPTVTTTPTKTSSPTPTSTKTPSPTPTSQTNDVKETVVIEQLLTSKSSTHSRLEVTLRNNQLQDILVKQLLFVANKGPDGEYACLEIPVITYVISDTFTIDSSDTSGDLQLIGSVQNQGQSEFQYPVNGRYTKYSCNTEILTLGFDTSFVLSANAYTTFHLLIPLSLKVIEVESNSRTLHTTDQLFWISNELRKRGHYTFDEEFEAAEVYYIYENRGSNLSRDEIYEILEKRNSDLDGDVLLEIFKVVDSLATRRDLKLNLGAQRNYTLSIPGESDIYFMKLSIWVDSQKDPITFRLHPPKLQESRLHDLQSLGELMGIWYFFTIISPDGSNPTKDDLERTLIEFTEYFKIDLTRDDLVQVSGPEEANEIHLSVTQQISDTMGSNVGEFFNLVSNVETSEYYVKGARVLIQELDETQSANTLENSSDEESQLELYYLISASIHINFANNHAKKIGVNDEILSEGSKLASSITEPIINHEEITEEKLDSILNDIAAWKEQTFNASKEILIDASR